MLIYILIASLLASGIAAIPFLEKRVQSNTTTINIDWETVLTTLETTTTLQVVANPMLLRNSSIHDNALSSLESVAANYVRFVPWYPYPKLAVPEIDAPVINGNECTTSWDFTYADPLMEDFFSSTPNVSHIINFSTSPGWMWVLPNGATYTYPDDINDTDFNYNQGTQLRDPSLNEISDYYSRLVSWYVQGGFTDECGVYHYSGHSYEIEYWEVLNEVDIEHNIQQPYYNQIYDAIVTAIREVSPNTKFVGLALAFESNLTYFEEFLDPSKHEAGIPLDFISYHWYGSPDEASTEAEAAQCFQQAETFLGEVTQIESIRKQLSPSTKTTLNEIGTFDPEGLTTINPSYEEPPEYFVWSGGVFAYVFSRIATMGIDVIGESQLVGYPSQYPSVSMVNYTTGLPNARLRVLQLLQQSFTPGDELVSTNSTEESNIHGQAFVTTDGVKKLLLVNKSPDTVEIQIRGLNSSKVEIVDVSKGGDIWRTEDFDGSVFNITGWATAVMTEN
jgi:hypothetical protein